MIQYFKKKQSMIWVTAITLALFFAYSCNDNSEKKSEAEVEVATPEAPAPQDSLPPIDSNATPRPDGIKTQPPQQN
ncbi:MAG TPA: hypothetical protein PK191_05775 [Niabella sp.]|nr:hypothetical protein [Niabella sp.]HOZ96016.1 hypothetical protein [Niabella sp.]HQW15489.1 hypothetical protein [Niabella sp.]HQX20631.1 hypothetical protein [Niabella sp.]HQX40507.1 hypothetical protein [Niabella sp.]